MRTDTEPSGSSSGREDAEPSCRAGKTWQVADRVTGVSKGPGARVGFEAREQAGERRQGPGRA